MCVFLLFYCFGCPEGSVVIPILHVQLLFLDTAWHLSSGLLSWVKYKFFSKGVMCVNEPMGSLFDISYVRPDFHQNVEVWKNSDNFFLKSIFYPSATKD